MREATVEPRQVAGTKSLTVMPGGSATKQAFPYAGPQVPRSRVFIPALLR